MSLRNIGIVYRKELTEALRDRMSVQSTLGKRELDAVRASLPSAGVSPPVRTI